MSKVIEVTSENFDKVVLQSDLPVLVDFWGPDCPHCMPLLPIMDELADDYVGRARIAKANLGDHPALRERLGIRGIPFVSVYKGGQVHSSLTGAHARSRYASILDLLVDSGSDEEAERVKQETDFLNCIIGKGDAATLEAILAQRPELANLPVVLEGRTRTPVKLALMSAKDCIGPLLAAGPELDHIELAGLGKTDELRAAIDANPALINEPDSSGTLALAIAVMQGETESAVALLQAGEGDARCSAESKNQALALAAWSGNTEILEKLIEHGASVAPVSATGTFHWAASSNHWDAIRILLEHGLDPESQNEDGVSIIDFVQEKLAERPELQDVLDLLKSKRAQRSRSA